MSVPARNHDSVTAAMVLPLLFELVEPGFPWVAGVPYEYLPSVPSTNAALKDVAARSRTGTALVTDDQTGGRGRLGRTWLSEPGQDLTFSVLLRPPLEPVRGHLLALATGVAVAEVLEERLGLRGQVALKWPNDVLLAGKKVCGILMEASVRGEGIEWAVAGVGVNVNGEPGRLRDSLPLERSAEWRGRPEPISLREHLGSAVTRAPLLAGLLARLTFRWSGLERENGVTALLEGWRSRDALAGRPVEVFAGADRSELVVTGEAAGVGPEGQLLVRAEGVPEAEDGLVEVFAGDVSVAASV